jgi:microcystin-dependent protein
VSHVQALVPKLAADLGGTGRSAFALPPLPGVQQSARFGSRGEDFPLVGRLQ